VSRLARQRAEAKATLDRINGNGASHVDDDELTEPPPAPEIEYTDADAPSDAAPKRRKPRAKRQAPEVAQPAEEDPWPHPVDGVELLDELVVLARRYMVLPEYAAEAIALWVLHTYLLAVADFTPYLLITSPVRGCGKTTLLDLAEHIAYRALKNGGITAAALYRVIDKRSPTMLLDELDTRLKGEGAEGLRGVLNEGFKRGGNIVICVGDTAEPRSFRVFSPKMLAGIGRVWDTVASRSIPIRLQRASKDELYLLKKMRGDLIHDQCAEYRRKALTIAAAIAADVREMDPPVPDALDSRQGDIWRPLLAIADIIGGHWPDTARTAAVGLHGVGDEETDYGLLMLEDVRDLFVKSGGDALFSAAIVEYLGKLEHRPWPEYRNDRPISTRGVASLLGRFGVKPKPVRFGSATGKGYAYATLLPVFEKYLRPLKSVTDTKNENRHTADVSVTGDASGESVTDVTDRKGGVREALSGDEYELLDEYKRGG
jgi:hypothetical protein